MDRASRLAVNIVFNQNGSNVRRAPGMEPPMPVDLESPPPRLADIWTRVRQTRLINQTINLAKRILPSGPGNCPVPGPLPHTETENLYSPPPAPPRTQVPPTSYVRRIANSRINYGTVIWVVGLSVVLLIVWLYQETFAFVNRSAVVCAPQHDPIAEPYLGKCIKWLYTDEYAELDDKQLRTTPAEKANKTKQSGKCVVPAYPEHGTYIIPNGSDATPGESFESLKLIVKCQHEYKVLGPEKVLCVKESWSEIPKCVRFCKLDNNTSVRYRCLVNDSIVGHRKCNDSEPSGTVVELECNGPHYALTTLPSMTCINGSWDHVATCSTECGRVTQTSEPLMSGGRSAKRGELPWHVGIYRKTTTPYEQICSGSIVSNSVVISAAQCFCNTKKVFWNDIEKLLPASRFAVAAGKIYRPWNNPKDNAQRSNVKEINIPENFQGAIGHFQDDIAVLILETPFQYLPFVRPVCLSFDFNFETKQLQPKNKGKVAGWGLTAENGTASQILKVVELPYVDVKQCIEESLQGFKGHARDKICAGYGKGTALCKYDTGGGLVFPEEDRYYLRGIVSTSTAPPTYENSCNVNALNTFTQILPHEHFISGYL